MSFESQIQHCKNAINTLYSRLLSTVGRGRITLVDDTGSVQIIQASVNPGESIDGIPRIGEFGFASNPPKDSDVAINFIGGNRTSGIAVGTNNQTSRMRNLAEGESAMYDNLGKYVYLTVDGLVINAGNMPVIINSATTVTINATTSIRMVTPLLEVTGNIIDNCDSQTDNLAGMRSRYDAHTHNGVQPGSGNTGLPNILE